MKELKIDLKALRKWIIDNHIDSQILDCSENAFQSYRIDNEEEFQCHFPLFEEEKLTKALYQVSLSIVCWREDEQECIIAYVRFEYNHKHVGEYKLIYSLDGRIIDDYLKIE